MQVKVSASVPRFDQGDVLAELSVGCPAVFLDVALRCSEDELIATVFHGFALAEDLESLSAAQLREAVAVDIAWHGMVTVREWAARLDAGGLDADERGWLRVCRARVVEAFGLTRAPMARRRAGRVTEASPSGLVAGQTSAVAVAA